MSYYPKIKTVKPITEKRIIVTFENDIKKIYDCSPLLKQESFRPLASDTLFNCIKVDLGGYGISWNEEIDLSESELWLNGISAEQTHTL
jgi:hypothetical protein